jgi:hypothetical protein
MPVVSLNECKEKFARLIESGGNPFLFGAAVHRDVGLVDEHGKRYLREDSCARHDTPGGPVGGDVPTLGPTRRCRPTDYRWDVLAEAMIGPDWRRLVGLDRQEAGYGVMEEMKRRFEQTRMYSEEAAAASTGGPSVWANVAAWSATVGGLMQAQFLEGYQVAGYDMADLFPVKAPVFWQGGERYISIIGPFTPAPEVGPGEEYPDMSMSALWVEPGPVKKYAGKISMYKETAAIDISGGQMMAKMREAGEMLKYRENELSLDVLCGQTNNWKLGMLQNTGATAYNTYGATVTNPAGTARLIDNTLVNPFNDFGAMQVSDERLANLYHPVSDQPLMTDLNTAIFPTPLGLWAVALNAASEIELMTQTVAGPAQTPGGAGFPTAKMKVKNPWAGIETITSRRLDARHVASTVQADPNLSPGLGLTGAARYRWYRLNRNRFACRRQFWPATTVNISPSDWVMATQGIVAASAFDIATMVQVLDPYSVQRNLGA